jgi:hypothetical protein
MVFFASEQKNPAFGSIPDTGFQPATPIFPDGRATQTVFQEFRSYQQIRLQLPTHMP